MQMHRENGIARHDTRRCLTSWRGRTPRGAIFAHLDASGAGLDPTVRQAIERLRSTQAEANT
jgi:hypothetical protein